MEISKSLYFRKILERKKKAYFLDRCFAEVVLDEIALEGLEGTTLRSK